MQQKINENALIPVPEIWKIPVKIYLLLDKIFKVCPKKHINKLLISL